MFVVLRYCHLSDRTDRLCEVWHLFVAICNMYTGFRESIYITVSTEIPHRETTI
jgi:hypothetical protein